MKITQLKITQLTFAAVALCVTFSAIVASTATAGASTELSVDVANDPSGSGWKCKRSNNVCGLDDPRQLSNPAKINYDDVLKATPSHKKMIKDGIDPNSPEGIRLRNKAADELKKAAEKVMKAKGHCSVWKKISHKDGRKIPDISKDIKAKL